MNYDNLNPKIMVKQENILKSYEKYKKKITKYLYFN